MDGGGVPGFTRQGSAQAQMRDAAPVLHSAVARHHERAAGVGASFDGVAPIPPSFEGLN